MRQSARHGVGIDTRSIDEDVRRRFEVAWHAGQPAPIEDFLPAADARHRATLHELVLIELEFAWKRHAGKPAGPRPALVEDYLRRFPSSTSRHWCWNCCATNTRPAALAATVLRRRSTDSAFRTCWPPARR